MPSTVCLERDPDSKETGSAWFERRFELLLTKRLIVAGFESTFDDSAMAVSPLIFFAVLAFTIFKCGRTEGARSFTKYSGSWRAALVST